MTKNVQLGDGGRADLVGRWFRLTREEMPRLAAVRDWPVRFDHCFQRILLDNAAGTKWREAFAAPAYRNAPDAVLEAAISLGRACIDGSADLAILNRRSLHWRGKGPDPDAAGAGSR